MPCKMVIRVPFKYTQNFVCRYNKAGASFFAEYMAGFSPARSFVRSFVRDCLIVEYPVHDRLNRGVHAVFTVRSVNRHEGLETGDELRRPAAGGRRPAAHMTVWRGGSQWTSLMLG